MSCPSRIGRGRLEQFVWLRPPRRALAGRAGPEASRRTPPRPSTRRSSSPARGARRPSTGCSTESPGTADDGSGRRPAPRRRNPTSAGRFGTREDHAGWPGQLARRAHNPKVAGSNPAPATKEMPGQARSRGPGLRHFPAPVQHPYNTNHQRPSAWVPVGVRWSPSALVCSCGESSRSSDVNAAGSTFLGHE